MWRKTRSQTNSRWGYICRGTDPNRNWSYKWGSKFMSRTIEFSENFNQKLIR